MQSAYHIINSSRSCATARACVQRPYEDLAFPIHVDQYQYSLVEFVRPTHGAPRNLYHVFSRSDEETVRLKPKEGRLSSEGPRRNNGITMMRLARTTKSSSPPRDSLHQHTRNVLSSLRHGQPRLQSHTVGRFRGQQPSYGVKGLPTPRAMPASLESES